MITPISPRRIFPTRIIPLLFASVLLASGLRAAEKGSNAELAEKLQNPVADLVSVQFQNNLDFGVGEHRGTLYLMNFQPVIPIHVTPSWNYIVRPVLPFISTSNVYGPGYVSGLGDLETETFLSPVKPGPFGIIWGLGPTAILPTATQRKLGGDVMTLGPSGVAAHRARTRCGEKSARHRRSAGRSSGTRLPRGRLHCFG